MVKNRAVGQGTSCLVVMVLMVTLFAAMPVGVVEPAIASPRPDDGVPERWIVGVEHVTEASRLVEERWRVLPGAHLIIEESTLMFSAHPGGMTGIVAEPGSTVAVRGSLLSTETPGAFIIHLEGASDIVSTTIRDAAHVVLQPRPVTDLADAMVGPVAAGDVPGWTAARDLTTPSATMTGAVVTSQAGPALYLGAPIQYTSSAPQDMPAIRLSETDVRTAQGPAVACHTTDVDPDLDSGLRSALARDERSWIRITGGDLHSDFGSVLKCPIMPNPPVAPARDHSATASTDVVPATDPPVITAGVGRFDLTGTVFSGNGTGLDLQTPGLWTVDGVTLRGLDTCAYSSVAFTLRGSTLLGCGTGILLEDSQHAVIQNNHIHYTEDPLYVHASDPDDANAYDHMVIGNTVNGLALLYVLAQDGFTSTTPAGHAVVAHSADVRLTKLDLRHGRLHDVASPGLLVGAPTDRQGVLLERLAPTLADAFETHWRDVAFELYPGALKGPNGTRAQGNGNALDQSWALLDSLRSLGANVRLVDGTLAVPAAAYMNWTGFTDLVASINVYGFSGRATFQTVTIDHTWVEVEVRPDVWVELDPSFAQYEHRDPLDWRALSDLDSERFYDPLMENVTLGDHWAQHLPFGYLHDEVTNNRARVVAELQDQDLTAADLFGARLHASTPAQSEPDRTPVSRATEVSAERMWSVHVRTQDPFQPTEGEFDTQLATPILYGKRLTVTGTPSTPEDRQRILDAGSLYDADRTTIQYTTGLWIDDVLVDLDGKWAMPDGSYEVRGTRSVDRHPGDPLTLVMDLRAPGPTTIATKTSPLTVGGTYSIVFDIGRTPAELATEEAQVLNRTAQAWDNGTAQDALDLGAQIHRLDGTAYFRSVTAYERLSARTHGLIDQPLLSVGVTGQGLARGYNGTTPVARPLAPFIDVQRIVNTYAKDGDDSREGPHNAAVGAYSSQMEDQIFTEIHNLPAVSTIKALTVANAEGQRLYQIDSDTIGTILPQLDLPQHVLNRIQSAVYAGRTVVAHERQITYHDWSGAGWIEMDLETGYAGWLIYGGVTLGSIVQDPVLLEGGSGALLIPPSEDELAEWEGLGYDDRQVVLDWTAAGWAVYGGASNVAEYIYKHGDELRFVQDPNNPQRFATIIRTTDESTAATKFFVHSTGSAGDFARRTANVALWAGVAFDTGLDAHRIYSDPADERPANEKHKEMAVSTAYNVGVAGAAWGGAKLVGAGGAVLCSAAPGAGTVVCGGVGGIIGAVGGGLIASSFKDDVVGWFTD